MLSGRGAALTQEPAAPPEAPPPEQPPAPIEERAHHHLLQNEHGFYEKIVFSGRLIVPQAIVLHWTGRLYDDRRNTVEEVIHDLSHNDACGDGGCSYSLFIDQEGIVYQLGEQLNTYTEHAPYMNGVALGLAFEGSEEAHLLNNPMMYTSGVETVRKLQTIFSISNNHDVHAKTGILGHSQTNAIYASNSKPDPGQEFLDRVRQDVAA